MDKIYIVKIRKIAFTKLRKLEVHSFFNQVVDVIKDYDTKSMHIGNTCHVLIGMQPKTEQLELTEKDFGPHHLTAQIDELHERRLKFVAIITNLMRTLDKADFVDKRHLVEQAKPIVLGNLNYLRQKDKKTVEEYINQFFYELKINPEVKDALLELGFKPYLDELEAANNAYKKIYNERSEQLSRRPKGSTLPVQRELQYILNILFEQVDYYQHVYKDVDYSRLITSLNYIIATYTKLIKTRDTQRKNKKLKAKEDEQAALEEKLRMERIEKNQLATNIFTPTATSILDKKQEQSNKHTTSGKKKKGKDMPINGLLDILRKPDKGKRDNDKGV